MRGTKDIDLLVDPSPENVRALKRAMASLPDNAISLVADDDVERYQVVRVADEIVVDLLARACGIGYEEASREVEHMEVGGVEIPTASKSLLIRTKDTYRSSDRADVMLLRALIDEEERAKGH